ncbi:peptidase inhibitor family I36 protein [Streptomyces mirabilis]|uniref:Peptidase inhibitor family I36 protein n=1 Tax=Streptomyces mirabilis TaxID=68239 RepID=A0ABU3V5Z3_9ACTN|nr:peptidase inhibitor family I36 protein [Streptomyces mirabilis]MCX5357059.1 peptidase inhibitor family I36 protein [Streptomyces mirabilis]MDU9001596.1 peptidase inhibitor family I36 protein [Streptomyces mirabilis]
MSDTNYRAAILAGATALSLAFLGLLAVESANAATTAEVCPQSAVCFYPQANYQGTVQILNFTATPGCRATIPARSVINNSSYPVGLYVDNECTQYLDQVGAGGRQASLIASVVTAE